MKFWICFLATVLLTTSYAEESSRAEMLDHFAGAWTTQAITCVAKLDVATHIGDKNVSIQQLAHECNCNEQKLFRIMRMLASKGIFQEFEEGLFGNTKTSQFLRTDHPSSMRQLAIWYGEEMYQALSSLYEGVKANSTPFEIAYGSSVFAYMKQHPDMQKRFLQSMQEKATIAISSCCEAYDFSQFNTIYDIGGGNGAFIQAITTRHPSVNGTLFELAAVANQLPPSPSYTTLEGDFFQEVPSGADCYILKSVLHDWDDEKASQILKNCYQAMEPSATVIIIEPVVKGANRQDYAKQLDILMLAVTGGRERSETEMNQLLENSGFTIETILDTSTEYKMIITHKS